MTRSIVLYLHVHQPFRVRHYSAFDTGARHDYFDEHSPQSGADNRRILRKVAEKSYLPTNRVLLEMLNTHPEFKLSLSITGTFIEQCEMWAPEVLDSFRKLVDTGRVEIVAETYYHSLAFFYSRTEFDRQVTAHREKVEQIFGVTPTAFRNTELAYNNDLAKWADDNGYQAILAEGWDAFLGWRSPNFVYRPAETKNIRLLLKNYKLSDDMAFRFGDRAWKEWPLTVEKYAQWLDATPDEPLINLFMDYETFGEHQWEDTGIFDFLRNLPNEWLKDPDHTFMTVTEAATTFPAQDTLDVPQTVTWADTERDLTAWLGNRMQQESMRYIYALEQPILATNDMRLISDWRNLQTSDHAYYMCTKWFNDGDVHAYFSPYDSPYDAFLYYMNALRDVRFRVNEFSQGAS